MEEGAPVTGAPVISLDLGALADLIISKLRDLILGWVQPLPGMAVEQLAEWIGRLWDAIWLSGLNIFGTPAELTIDFPPAQILGERLFLLVYGITALAVVLLALRNVWRTMTGSGGFMNDAVNGILMSILLSGASTIIVLQGYGLVWLLSDALGRLDYRAAFEPHNLITLGPDLLIGLFIIVVMIFYGWKLTVRGAYRVVLLAFTTPFAPVAGALWGIPQFRWISASYYTLVFGWLAGGALAIGAISLAVQMAVFGNTNGILALIFGVALLQVAHDLMGLLAKPAFGGMQVGSPFSGLMSAAVGGVAGAAVGAAAVAGASAAGSGGGAMAALPSGDRPGFGYD